MPRSNAAAMEETHRRLLRAASRGFRTHGFGGLGVDAVAKDAGVTSGAFYAHFGSKRDAFRETLQRGFAELRDGIRSLRAAGDAGWLRRFAVWYMSAQRRADLAGSCVLPTLTLEAARGDAQTRVEYDARLREVIAALTAAGPGRITESQALAVLALLAGGLSIAHAVDDERLGAKIARAVADAVVTVAARPA